MCEKVDVVLCLDNSRILRELLLVAYFTWSGLCFWQCLCSTYFSDMWILGSAHFFPSCQHLYNAVNTQLHCNKNRVLKFIVNDSLQES